jgi:aspartate kinase
MIIQSQRCRIVDGIPMRDIAFTVAQNDAQQAEIALEKLRSEIKFKEVVVNTNVAKVSIVGSGMVGSPGVAAKFFQALADEKINIQMITTSEIKISCVVDQEEGVQALKAVHEAFGLSGDTVLEVPSKEG